MLKNRVSVKFGGTSGQGINTVGRIFANSVTESGYKIFAYREYPSVIRGGVASYQIDISNKEINSSSRECDILMCFTPESVKEYLRTISEDGLLIYDDKEVQFTEDEEAEIQKKNIKTIYIDSQKIAVDAGGVEIMSNVVMLGFLWKVLSQECDTLVDVVLEFFKHKNVDFDAEKKCILAGYNSPTYRPELSKTISLPKEKIFKKPSYVLTGNDALALGAIACGVRAYYAYPMTPATSIFKILGESSTETGMLVKQAENEITAVQLALGSMFMGTRALVATSGGGFDLMVESLTCAGISETPLVIVLSQRTGAATGVPTWTGSGDLNTALKAGHGEFPRCVISVSDTDDSYTLIQHAFNISERYQMPVILLTEKQISESLFTRESMPKNIRIERGLEEGAMRYEITENGISPRWIPSKDKKTYLSSSDEHYEHGVSTERGEEIITMSDKRMRKLETLSIEIPEPVLYGNENASTTFIGWGSVKNTILDVIDMGENINYLHYSYIHPFKEKELVRLHEKGNRLILVENNQTGQLGKYIKEETGITIKERLLKYDARPFFVEDILDFLKD